ncbi:MAG TPA: four helix bundle protein [Patescibacteria group bacterium]|nr:four helix bundle protein [Patescibacteria group bacterium]
MENNNGKKQITSFRDLDVYQNAYRAMLTAHKEVLPKLPVSERFDLRDQLSRSTKAVPRLIAEGYTKKHQRAGFQKYLDDAHTESNETIVGLEQCKDLYSINPALCDELIDIYDKISRQLFNLAEAWDKFQNRRRTLPLDNTRGAAE